MTLRYDNRMPLGGLLDSADEALRVSAVDWLIAVGEQPPVQDDFDLDSEGQVILVQDARGRLKIYYLARFALAVAARMEYHARGSLERAQAYGATYQEAADAIGSTRQTIQRRYGLRASDRSAAEKAVASAVKLLDPPPHGGQWGPVSVRHNYDPANALSAAQVSTGSGRDALVHVLLFHRGEYLGTALDEPVVGARLLLSMCTDSVVAIGFDEASAGPASSLTSRFRWLDGQVKWFGDLPDGQSTPVASCGYVRFYATDSATSELFKCENTYVHESHINGSTVLRVQRPDAAVEYLAGTRYDSRPLEWHEEDGSVVVTMNGRAVRKYSAGAEVTVATRRNLVDEAYLADYGSPSLRN